MQLAQSFRTLRAAIPHAAAAAPLAPLSMDRLIGFVEDLPALPDVAMKVTRLIDDPHASAAAIGRLIAIDQALTARVLRLANSSFYGLSRRIGTVQEAVIVLGFRTVKSITLAAALYPSLNAEARGYGLGRGELWRHALACGVCARSVAKSARPNAPSLGPVTEDEAFVAGLLHDIGKMVLGMHAADHVARARVVAVEQQISLRDAERQVVGFDHAQAGAALAEKWNLPAPLVDAIAHHHDPLAASHGNVGLVCATHVADILCTPVAPGSGSDAVVIVPTLDGAAVEALSLTAELNTVSASFADAMAAGDPAFELDKQH